MTTSIIKQCRTCGSDMSHFAESRRLYCKRLCRPSYYKEKALIGLCELCGKERKLFKDHNHDTGEWRGRICCRCNTLLGAFDDKVFFLKATIYLERYRPAVKPVNKLEKE